MRHLIDPLDFTLEETTKVLDLADRIAESPEVYSHVADGKKIATLFYEPSTRTRLSFESAMLSLGGKSLGFAGAEQSLSLIHILAAGYGIKGTYPSGTTGGSTIFTASFPQRFFPVIGHGMFCHKRTCANTGGIRF